MCGLASLACNEKKAYKTNNVNPCLFVALDLSCLCYLSPDVTVMSPNVNPKPWECYEEIYLPFFTSGTIQVIIGSQEKH